jgi:hypothetical protein
MKSTIIKNISIPSRLYYANKYEAVRSILGNDVEIEELNESNILLPNNNLIINVKYSMLNFNSFKIYKATKTKLLMELSDKYVIDEIIDTITDEKIKIKIISNFNITGDFKYISLWYYNSSYPEFSLYAKEVTKSNIFHSYCSVFDNSYLSYHGTAIEHILDPKKQFKSLVKSTLNINFKEESKAFHDFIKFKNNNFNNSCYDISYLKSLNLNENELNEKESETNPYIIDLSNSTPNDLNKFIGTTGVLLLSENRKNPFVVVKIPNEDLIITKNTINNLIIVLEYDGFNYNLLN